MPRSYLTRFPAAFLAAAFAMAAVGISLAMAGVSPLHPGEASMGAPLVVTDPSFNVYVTSNEVHGYEWPLGEEVTLLIDDPGIPGPVDYSDAQTVVVADWDPGQTWVQFVVPVTFDVQPGHIVTLTHDTTVKTHTVTSLAVTSVDPDTDTISGTADPVTVVWVNTCCSTRHEVADGVGDWTADFSTFGDEDFEQDTYDIVPGSGGQANQQDPDGDGTVVDWQVPNPRFWVSPVDERVDGYEWPEGAEVTLLIDDPGIPGPVDYSDSQIVTSDPCCGTFVAFDLQGAFDVQPGHIVTLTDGVTVKTHTVTNLTVTGQDLDLDTVTGTADTGTDVDVNVCDESSCANRHEVADEFGDWTADFSAPGDEPGEEDTYDVVPGSQGETNQWDDDNDGTHVHWQVPNPVFRVSVTLNGVQGWDWEEGALVTLTIDDPLVPGPVDYTDDQTVTSVPCCGTMISFQFQGFFDVQPGHVVTLTEGATVKTHTVTNLTVTGADPDTDTVSGTADPATDVNVDICYESGCASRHEVANGSGDWSANFSTPGDEDFEQDTYDVVPGSGGQASQVDADGDQTVVGWRVPNPYFAVDPDRDSVWQWGDNDWPEGATVTLTIDDDGDPGNGILYTAATQVGAWGDFRFDLLAQFDVQPGHVVTVADGTTTKTHTVTNLAVTSVDPDTDTVSGTADAGADVWIDIWDEFGSQRHEVADGLGDWTADFSTPGDEDFEQDTFNIGPGTQGAANQSDDDGDATVIDWLVPNPSFQAWPEGDFVHGNEWPEGALVTLTIDDPGIPGPVDYTDSQTVTFDPCCGVMVNFDLQGIFDIQAGHIVTLTDGVTVKTHTVTDLTVTSVDPDTDTVTGTADPGSDVWVDTCCSSRHEVANGSGDWSADFSTPGDEDFEQNTFDIVPGSGGQASQSDDDGDATQVNWRVPNPNLWVSPVYDLVDGNEWPEGALVTLTIDDPGTGPGVDYTDSQIAGPIPWNPQQIGVRFEFQGLFDVQPSHVVALTDGVTTKTHTVTNVSLSGVDPDTDTVSGTADPDSDVWVQIWDEFGTQRHEVADGFGDWTADFSTPGDEPGEEQTYDIGPGSQGQAWQPDDEGDVTVVHWRVPNTRFWVSPLEDSVMGFEWPLGVEVTLTIDDPVIPGLVDYTDSQIVGPHPMDPQQTFANFELQGAFDVQPGHVVTLTDGVTTKVHTVTNLTVAGMDPDTDTVSGTADPGTDVGISVCDGTGCGYRHEVADGFGDWTADFSIFGDEDFEQHTSDIVPGTTASVDQGDADGDATSVYLQVILLLGDVNCDDVVNVIDALFILQYEVGLRAANSGCPLPPSPPDTLNVDACDVNDDTLCNVVDALFVLQCEVGIPNALCPAAASTKTHFQHDAYQQAVGQGTRYQRGVFVSGVIIMGPIYLTQPEE